MVGCCMQAAEQRAMVQSAVESAALADRLAAARPGPHPAHDAAAVGPSAAASAGSAPGAPSPSTRAASGRSTDMVNPSPADAAAAEPAAAAAAAGVMMNPEPLPSTEEAAAGLVRRVAALTAERRVLKAVARLSLAVTTDVLTGATLPYRTHTPTRCNKSYIARRDEAPCALAVSSKRCCCRH